MTEGIKTLIYLGVALLVALVAFMSRPRIEEFKVSELENKALFEKFDDPAKADRMGIVRYDETLGTLDEFRVARDKASGAWTLPSHGGYPADAETRVRDAALLLVDLQVLGIASTVSGDHRLFGVIEPDKDKLKVGDEGVGLLVRFEDGKGQDLASLIIGKKVKGTDDQRFVREPKKDVVYTVRIDPDKLSTKFQDWIEKDLFKDLKGWDVENVALKNYTVSLQPPNRVLIDKKFDLAADFKDSEWKLRELTKYSQGEGAVVALSDQEELNKDKLNDLKTAVDELEIADVRRKPKGLGADLKAGEGYAKDDEGVVDLAKHGFYMVPTANNEVELLSANGEVSVANEGRRRVRVAVWGKRRGRRRSGRRRPEPLPVRDDSGRHGQVPATGTAAAAGTADGRQAGDGKGRQTGHEAGGQSPRRNRKKSRTPKPKPSRKRSPKRSRKQNPKQSPKRSRKPSRPKHPAKPRSRRPATSPRRRNRPSRKRKPRSRRKSSRKPNRKAKRNRRPRQSRRPNRPRPQVPRPKPRPIPKPRNPRSKRNASGSTRRTSARSTSGTTRSRRPKKRSPRKTRGSPIGTTWCRTRPSRRSSSAWTTWSRRRKAKMASRSATASTLSANCSPRG